MKRRYLAFLSVGFAVLAGAASSLHAQFNPATYTFTEPEYFNSFGGPVPAGYAQYAAVSGGFGFTIADKDGRTLSTAAAINNGSTTLTTINPSLWLGGDAVLFQIAIANPATFTAQIAGASSTDILALFNSSGTALSAAVGGGTVLGPSNDGITAPGVYYIGTSTPGYYPENAEGQNIFGLTATDGAYSPVTSDLVLSSTDYQAWTLPGTAPANPGQIIGTSSEFISGSGADISLTGVPEPASASLLVVGGLGLLARRRKARA